MRIIFITVCFALQVYTIIHVWKHLSTSTLWKVIWTLLLLLLGGIGVIFYWLYYAIKGRKGNLNTKRDMPYAPHATVQDTLSGNQASTALSSYEEEENDEKEGDGKSMRALFNEVMYGANGKILSESYEKLMNMFIMKENGECKGAGFTGILDERARSKRLEKVDNQVIIPALGHNPAMYEAWWTIFYEDVLDRMQNSPNAKQRNLLEAVLADVERGDRLLQVSGAFEYMQQQCMDEMERLAENVTLTTLKGKVVNTHVILKSKNEGKNIKITTSYDTVKINRKEKHGKVYYKIKGAYKYFYLGLSEDELIRTAEILMAVPSILQYGLKDGVSKVWMEEHDLPSLSKL